MRLRLGVRVRLGMRIRVLLRIGRLRLARRRQRLDRGRQHGRHRTTWFGHCLQCGWTYTGVIRLAREPINQCALLVERQGARVAVQVPRNVERRDGVRMAVVAAAAAETRAERARRERRGKERRGNR